MATKHRDLQLRRRARLRFQLRKKANGRHRMSVFRSNNHIHVQVIDDANGHTVAAASSLEKALHDGKFGNDKETAAKIGGAIATRALDKGIKEVVFDRGSALYHGRVKALADAAREAGLDF